MVRSIAGALIDVGTGKLAPEHIKNILESRIRTALVVTAPAQGLSLDKVFY
jgi:tRNA pseudouridine38-40 synthase